jgi:hypothetical protein
MKRMLVIAGAVLGSALLAPPAMAQASNPPQPFVRQLPPERLHPNSPGLIEQGFEYLRRTSPNPDKFMGGRWNPRFEVVNPTPWWSYVPPTGGGYYPYFPPAYGYYGYPNYGYQSFGYYPQNYGYGYAGPTAVQREVIVVPQVVPQASQPYRQPAADASRKSAPPKSGSEDFYLKESQEGVSAALDDLRKAWLDADAERLRARIKPDASIRIYPGGQYRYSVASADFVAMMGSAAKRLQTFSMEFDRPRSLGEDRVFVSGRHVYRDANGAEAETNVSYVLERVKDRWVIAEAGSGTAPISSHRD